MKRIPTYPYLANIAIHYHEETKQWPSMSDYRVAFHKNHYSEWLEQFGFLVPIFNDYLEFPEDFPDKELMWFMLRWS